MGNLFFWIVIIGGLSVLMLNVLHRHNVHLSPLVTALTTNGTAKYFGIAILVIVGLLTLLWLMPLITKVFSDSSSIIMTATVILSALIVGGLAIAGAFGKAGNAGRFALLFLVLVAVFFLTRAMYLSLTYGPYASEAQLVKQVQNFESVHDVGAARGVSERVQPLGGTESMEVVAQNFVIPANGSVTVPRYNKACVANSTLGSHISRNIKPREIVFVSEGNGDEYARVWLYDQGTAKNCKEQYDLLHSRGKIF